MTPNNMKLHDIVTIVCKAVLDHLFDSTFVDDRLTGWQTDEHNSFVHVCPQDT